MAAVMASSFARVIEISGDTAVTYNIANISGSDGYGEPTITYSGSTIQAYVEPLGDREIALIEPGFIAGHYVKLYMPHSTITPSHQDRFTWASIQFEIRSVIPRKWDSSVIFYEILGRRLSV